MMKTDAVLTNRQNEIVEWTCNGYSKKQLCVWYNNKVHRVSFEKHEQLRKIFDIQRNRRTIRRRRGRRGNDNIILA